MRKYFEKILWDEWEQKHKISKLIGSKSSSAYREMCTHNKHTYFFLNARAQICKRAFHCRKPLKEE